MSIKPKLIPIEPERIGQPGRERLEEVKEIYPVLFLNAKDFPILEEKEAGEEFIIMARINIKEKNNKDDGETKTILEFKEIASIEDAITPEEQKNLDEKVREGKIKLY